MRVSVGFAMDLGDGGAAFNPYSPYTFALLLLWNFALRVPFLGASLRLARGPMGIFRDSRILREFGPVAAGRGGPKG